LNHLYRKRTVQSNSTRPRHFRGLVRKRSRGNEKKTSSVSIGCARLRVEMGRTGFLALYIRGKTKVWGVRDERRYRLGSAAQAPTTPKTQEPRSKGDGGCEEGRLSKKSHDTLIRRIENPSVPSKNENEKCTSTTCKFRRERLKKWKQGTQGYVLLTPGLS